MKTLLDIAGAALIGGTMVLAAAYAAPFVMEAEAQERSSFHRWNELPLQHVDVNGSRISTDDERS